MASSSDLTVLTDMGFDSSRAKIALKQGSLQNALDWLEKTQDQDLAEVEAEAKTQEDGNVAGGSQEHAQSLVCNDCQKQLRGVAEAEYHASKTGHENFAESTAAVTPLTEEEKKARLEALRQKLAAKRAGTAEEDKVLQRRNEEIRRKSTKETQDIKEDLAKKQQLKDAAAKKKEKLDDLAAKQRIKDKIAADKEERRVKAERERLARSQAGSNDSALAPAIVAPAQTPIAPSPTSKPSSSYTETRMRLITPHGTLTKSFSAENTLFDVVMAIKEEFGDFEPSAFVQNFPKKTFDTVDFGETLKKLSLVPSASLNVR